jgi:hypothetical protein
MEVLIMAIITNENIKDFMVTGAWNISGSMKPDGESTDTKKFTLKVKFNNVPVIDIINKALDPTKIQWVNGVGRKRFDTYTNSQTIDIDFKSPARAPQLSVMEQFKLEASAEGIDINNKVALTAYITKRLDKVS